MKILILGGSGFIGKSVAKHLKLLNINSMSLSRRNKLDLTDYENTFTAFKKVNPDVIINCATQVGSLHYVSKYGADIIYNNSNMILNIYKAIKNLSKKIKVINPIANCGYPSELDNLEEKNFFKGDVHSSVYGYGHTRRLLIVTSNLFHKQYGINTQNIIIPNAYGPGDSVDPNKTHALNGMVIRMLKANNLKSKKFKIWGSGKPIREWAYVDDIARILIDLIKVKEDFSMPINFAQMRGYSIKESAEMISKVIKFKGVIVFDKTYQDGSLKKVMCDKKFKFFFPQFKFKNIDEGILNTVDFYRKELRNEK